MMLEAWLALIVAGFLLGYLVHSMLRPERY
jgi:K+-transporting ATPase KdpF subunit